jgi:hypothetical protein
LNEFVGKFIDDWHVWTSFYLERTYFNKDVHFPKILFNKRISNLEEILDVIIKSKTSNPYCFVLSNSGFEIIKDFVLDYYSVTMHTELENKLYRLMSKDYNSYSSTNIFSSLDSLIENYLLII